MADTPTTYESDLELLRTAALTAGIIAASYIRRDLGWLSEETADDLKRLEHKRVFVVDPIDGTRGFIKGEDSWTVSLAVVENGVPVAGVVFAPARNEMFCG